MSIRFYNFAGGVGTPGHKCTYFDSETLPAPTAGVEASSADYLAISSVDGNSFKNESADKMPGKIYRFYVPIAEPILSITAIAHGYAEWFSEEPYNFYIRRSGEWQLLGSHENGYITQITGIINVDAGDCLSGGYVYLMTLCGQLGGDDKTAKLRDDYVGLTVEFKNLRKIWQADPVGRIIIPASTREVFGV